jgi:serine protease
VRRRNLLLSGLALGVAAALKARGSATPGPGGAQAECNVHSGYGATAPAGIGLDNARDLAGGAGERQHFIDVELGWTLNHDCLLAHRIGAPLSGVIDESSRAHGTAVLGIVCGSSPDGGYTGLAPRVASVHVSSTSESQRAGIAAAIDKLVSINAADRGSAGGVLLLETQTYLVTPQGGMGRFPAEALPELFELIESATRRGITVIEAAGNGRDTGGEPQGIDLDRFANERGEPFLRRDSARGDSGAIIVGAARSVTAARKHGRVTSSNYGSIVDCYAWGERVAVPSDSGCTVDFGETSAAAAIIAGVALIVQGVVAAARPGVRLPPRRLREILSDGALGTPCADGGGHIGVMPDLARILDPAVLGITPVRRSRSRVAARG